MISTTGRPTSTGRADGVPDRSDLAARVAEFVSRARVVLLMLSPDEARQEGERALDLAERFARGEAIEPRTIEDSLMNEEEQGILLHEQRASGTLEQNIWSAVASVVGYAAWAAATARGEPLSALVEYFDLPEAPDVVEEALRTAESSR